MSEITIMQWLSVITTSVVWYMALKEIYKLSQWIKEWNFVYWSKTHSVKHIIIFIMLLSIDLWAVWLIIINSLKSPDPFVMYNLVLIFFIIPHLSEEFEDTIK